MKMIPAQATPAPRAIHRAVSQCGPWIPRTIEHWSDKAASGATRLWENAGTPEEARLYRAIAAVANGIRWAQMTGRVDMAAWNSMPWRRTRSIVEDAVAACLRADEMSWEFVKNRWHEIACAREPQLGRPDGIKRGGMPSVP